MSMARGQQRAFTLVEVCITLAILALAVGVALPAMNSQSRADLRQGASMIAGHIRGAYDSASLSGQTYRLLFDLKAGTVNVESSEQILAIDPDSNALVQANKSVMDGTLTQYLPDWAEQDEEKDDDEEEERKPQGAGAALAALNREGEESSAGGFTQAEKPFKLESSVHFLDMWIEGMDAPETTGQVSLLFFPNGYTQDAIIHVEDDDDRVFAIKIAGLTGKVTIIPNYVEASK